MFLQSKTLSESWPIILLKTLIALDRESSLEKVKVEQTLFQVTKKR